MMIRALIAALPLATVLAACGDAVTAPRQVDIATEFSSPAFTASTDTVPSDTTSDTGGPLGSGS